MPFDAGGAGGRRRHRRADAGLDARDLLRVRLGVLPAGRRRDICSRRWAWRWCSRCWPPMRISRTLTPIIIGLLLRGEQASYGARQAGSAASTGGSIAVSNVSATFMPGCSPASCAGDHRAARSPWLVVAGAVVISLFVGSRLLSAGGCRPDSTACPRPGGTRIERTEQIFQAVEDKIREVSPSRTRAGRSTISGCRSAPIIWPSPTAATIGVNDGQILVALKEGHAPTADYVKQAARGAAGRLPGRGVLFPAGRHRDADPEFRRAVADRCAGARPRPCNNLEVATELAAAHVANPGHRRCASTAGARCAGAATTRSTAHARSSLASTSQPIVNNMNISLSSSQQVSPNFWTDPEPASPTTSRCRRRNTGSPAQRSQQHADRASSRRRQRRSRILLGNVATLQRVTVQSDLQPIQYPAGLRRLCQRPGPRPRQRRRPTIRKVVAGDAGQAGPATASWSAARSRA